MKNKIYQSLKQPCQTKNNLFDILVGGILLFFPIINFLSLGYVTKKLQNIIALDKTSVKWDNNSKQLFLLGIQTAFILAVYAAIPFFFMFLGGFFMSNLSQGKIWSLSFLRGQILEIIASILLLIATYLAPMAICITLEDNNLAHAFDLRTILERILLNIRDYSLAYLSIFGIYLLSTILTVLFLNFFIALILAGFLYFYDGLFTVYLLGKVYPRKSVTMPIQPNSANRK